MDGPTPVSDRAATLTNVSGGQEPVDAFTPLTLGSRHEARFHSGAVGILEGDWLEEE